MQEINKENMIMKPKKQLIETAVKDGSIDRMNSRASVELRGKQPDRGSIRCHVGQGSVTWKPEEAA